MHGPVSRTYGGSEENRNDSETTKTKKGKFQATTLSMKRGYRRQSYTRRLKNLLCRLVYVISAPESLSVPHQLLKGTSANRAGLSPATDGKEKSLSQGDGVRTHTPPPPPPPPPPPCVFHIDPGAFPNEECRLMSSDPLLAAPTAVKPWNRRVQHPPFSRQSCTASNNALGTRCRLRKTVSSLPQRASAPWFTPEGRRC